MYKDVDLDLNFLSNQDAYAVAIATLYSLRDKPEYSTLSELVYLLDYNNFMKLIKYYGGQTIRIPSLEEVSDIMKLLLLYQNYYVNDLSWSESLCKSGVSQEESLTYRNNLRVLKKVLDKLNVPRGTSDD